MVRCCLGAGEMLPDRGGFFAGISRGNGQWAISSIAAFAQAPAAFTLESDGYHHCTPGCDLAQA
jgi:hypothetical protein